MQRKLKYFYKKRGEIKTLNEMPQIEVNGEILEQCENCGNIWDGYAQCNCWQMDFDESADESGYETE
jgi:hypothetical protein